MPPRKGDNDYVDYVIALAKGPTLREGVINEPRVFYDEIPLNADTAVITPGSPGVFVNGEQFPIRLTHLLACVRYLDQANEVTPEQFAQLAGLRMTFHNQFYMNPVLLPLPVWGNKVTAAPEPASLGNAHWDLVANGRPFVLSARDTLVVTVQLQDAAPIVAGHVPATIVLTGFGMLSHRPYLFSSSVELSNSAPTNFSTVDLRNDGSEPIAITDITVHVSGATNSEDPSGAIGRIRLNIKQVGNGTNASWFIGPATPPSQPRMQATLLGVTTGRAIVHQFPGDGLIWHPAEGITVEMQARLADLPLVICLALSGYIMVE